MAEKPLISEETDLIEPSLLDELICHISSLASVYHRPPSSFVAGRATKRATLPPKPDDDREHHTAAANIVAGDSTPTLSQVAGQPAPIVEKPTSDSLLGDLLDMGSTAPPVMNTQPSAGGMFGAPMQPQPTSSKFAVLCVFTPAFYCFFYRNADLDCYSGNLDGCTGPI